MVRVSGSILPLSLLVWDKLGLADASMCLLMCCVLAAARPVRMTCCKLRTRVLCLQYVSMAVLELTRRIIMVFEDVVVVVKYASLLWSLGA